MWEGTIIFKFFFKRSKCSKLSFFKECKRELGENCKRYLHINHRNTFLILHGWDNESEFYGTLNKASVTKIHLCNLFMNFYTVYMYKSVDIMEYSELVDKLKYVLITHKKI